MLADSHEDEILTSSPEKLYHSSTSAEKVGASSDSENSLHIEIALSGEDSESKVDLPWSKDEDQILLENVQKEYSEKTFVEVSNILKDRSLRNVSYKLSTMSYLQIFSLLYNMIFYRKFPLNPVLSFLFLF